MCSRRTVRNKLSSVVDDGAKALEPHIGAIEQGSLLLSTGACLTGSFVDRGSHFAAYEHLDAVVPASGQSGGMWKRSKGIHLPIGMHFCDKNVPVASARLRMDLFI